MIAIQSGGSVVKWCGSFKNSTYRVGVAERGGEREREESGDANDKFVCSDRS